MEPPKNSKNGRTQKYTPFTGRDIKKISSPFVGGDDRLIIVNEGLIRRLSYEEKKAIIPRLTHDVSYDTLLKSIHGYIISQKKASDDTTNQYN